MKGNGSGFNRMIFMMRAHDCVDIPIYNYNSLILLEISLPACASDNGYLPVGRNDSLASRSYTARRTPHAGLSNHGGGGRRSNCTHQAREQNWTETRGFGSLRSHGLRESQGDSKLVATVMRFKTSVYDKS